MLAAVSLSIVMCEKSTSPLASISMRSPAISLISSPCFIVASIAVFVFS